METTENRMAATYSIESFICPNCGGGLGHDQKKDKFLCSSCGYEGEISAVAESVQEYSFEDYPARESESVAFVGMSVAVCGNCGCEVTFSDKQIATICPMGHPSAHHDTHPGGSVRGAGRL